MRTFVSEVAPNLIKKTDYILSRQYGVLTRTTYSPTNTTDSTQSQVNEESKFDNIRDKHGIYGGMMYDEHYQIDFPCYESCLLYKVTFQVIAPFDAGTKIGIFNDKAPVVILDVYDPTNAGDEHDYHNEINATVEDPLVPIDESVYTSTFDTNYENIIIPSIYNAKNTNFTDAAHDPYGRDSNVMPDVNFPTLIVGDVFKFTGESYTYDYYKDGQLIATWHFVKNNYYIITIVNGDRWWLPVFLSDNIGYEYYFIKEPIDASSVVTRTMPRIINVDPYETDEGELIPVQLHARIIGNESKSAFGYLTVETYPIKRQ